MRTIQARPLTAAAFAPFGDVLEAPADTGRVYIEDALANGRPDARASLSFARTGAAASLPLDVRMMERHEFSSQSFIPLSRCRWLVVVAPAGPAGGPDAAGAQAFLAAPGQGLSYGMNIWHHPLTVLDEAAAFAIVMWRTGGPGDEEFADLATPFRVALA
jgi:ureidoglycolate lyase